VRGLNLADETRTSFREIADIPVGVAHVVVPDAAFLKMGNVFGKMSLTVAPWRMRWPWVLKKSTACRSVPFLTCFCSSMNIRQTSSTSLPDGFTASWARIKMRRSFSVRKAARDPSRLKRVATSLARALARSSVLRRCITRRAPRSARAGTTGRFGFPCHLRFLHQLHQLAS